MSTNENVASDKMGAADLAINWHVGLWLDGDTEAVYAWLEAQDAPTAIRFAVTLATLNRHGLDEAERLNRGMVDRARTKPTGPVANGR